MPCRQSYTQCDAYSSKPLQNGRFSNVLLCALVLKGHKTEMAYCQHGGINSTKLILFYLCCAISQHQSWLGSQPKKSRLRAKFTVKLPVNRKKHPAEPGSGRGTISWDWLGIWGGRQGKDTQGKRGRD